MSIMIFIMGEAESSIQLNGTRVVYPAGKREVSFSMVNNGSEARLIQSWVDTGDIRENPDSSTAPFMITPPMVRVDAGKGQTLRIVFTGQNIAQDRESVFWLNILEIPPKPKLSNNEGENYVQMAVRSRIKIFYRPQGLDGKPDNAAENLIWKMRMDRNRIIMTCINNTAYNVSFSDISLKNSPVNRNVSKGGMCPAKGTSDFPVSGDPSKAGGKIVLTTINDYGAYITVNSNFSQ